MNKLASIAFAAGLALTGSCGRSAAENCEQISPEELCEQEAGNDCHQIIRTTKEQALSACMKRKKNIPLLCNYDHGIWDCGSRNTQSGRKNIGHLFQ